MKSGEEQVRAINVLNSKVAGLEQLLEVYELTVLEQADKLMKNAEREKEADHRFHQKVIDTIPNPVFYKDVRGECLGGNRAFAEFIGTPIEELIGKTVFDMLPQDQASQIHDSELKLFQKEELQIDEISLANDDGTCRDVISFMSTFPAADGSPGGFIQTLLDISMRKRAEMELRESRQRLSDIIQFYPDATMVIDGGGKVVAWNLAMEEMTGVRAEEMLGKGEYEYAIPFYGERRPILIDLVSKPDGETEKKNLRTGWHGNVVGEAYVRNERGEELYLQGTAAPLFNSGGEIAGAIESFRDTTERKRMEDTLRTLSCGIEQSPASIIITDREGNIEYVNPKFTRLTGYTSAEAVGQTPRILKSGKTSAEAHLQLWETILSGGEWHGEFCNRKKNGDLFWESASISPIVDAEGNITRFIAVKEDITERKWIEEERLQAEEALRESEERFRQIAEHSGEVFFLVTCDMSRTIYISPAYEKIWQLSCRSLYENPLSFTDIIHEEDRLRVLIALEKQTRGELFEETYRIVRPDRTVRWIHARTYPVHAENGEVYRWAGIAEDVTKQKLGEEHVHKLQQAVEQSPVSIVITDSAGNIEYVNPKFTQSTGYSRDEVSGQSPRILKSGETPAEIYRQMWENITAGSEWRGEILNRKKSGELFWESVSISPIKNPAGEITHYLSAKEDITERKRAEEELRESRQRLLDIIQFYPDATMVIDGEEKVVAWNLAMEEMTGVRAEEILGKGEYEYAIPFYGERRPILIDLVLKPDGETEEKYQRTGWHGNTLVGEAFVHSLRGEVRFLLGNAAPLYDTRGEIIGAIESIRDITERKQMEEDLEKARDAAEGANRLKSEFLANMSHEIRTPMNGVIGMTDLLKDTDLDKEQTEYVRAVRSSAESLLTVINDILDFSKIEAKKLDLEIVNFELRSSLGNILRTLAYQAAEKGLELTFRVSSDVPDAVVGDPGRLRQVIVNLVSNAVKFTERGEVALSVGSERDREDEACLHFAIVDTGIGISAQKQQRIFDPFSQADPSTTRRYGGTGLGLTISARLVEMMGGRIWVESTVGRGSTFHFTVRFGLQKGLPVRTVPEEPEFLRDLSVLVVDDNATTRGILEEMLKNWRMRPATADSGEKALRMLAEARQSGRAFRLLLLDVVMPGMDGFDLVEKIIKSQEEFGATIMMLTAVGQRGDAARCRELGISAYLTKPIGQSSLLDAILNVLGRTVPEIAETPLVTIHSLREKQGHLRILLAEDNAVNQRITVRMLEKLGHCVTAAANGRETVAALAGQGDCPFDLILMDVQMPEMDGFEATAAIRKEEGAIGCHIPIIALTANAMDGDRENCLRAGMDGYVSKPIKAEDLLIAIETVLNNQGLRMREASGAPSEGECAFDHQEALARMGGDWTLFREVVGIFAEEYPKQMAELRDAIGAVDPLRISRAAHALKGAVANFGARAPFEAALKLEMMGKLGELAEAPESIAALEGEIVRLQRSLAAFIGGTEYADTDRRG